MASAKPLLLVVLVVCFAGAGFAADDGSQSQASAGSAQAADPALVGPPVSDLTQSSELFFLKTQPRLKLSLPAARPQSAVLDNRDCYTMRMYKVKRKEHFADRETGFRGYSTCELAKNYQVRSAIAHPQTLEGNDSQIIEPQK